MNAQPRPGGPARFLRQKAPYLVGLAAIEVGIFYFDGPTGDVVTGLPAFLALWAFYGLMSRP